MKLVWVMSSTLLIGPSALHAMSNNNSNYDASLDNPAFTQALISATDTASHDYEMRKIDNRFKSNLAQQPPMAIHPVSHIVNGPQKPNDEYTDPSFDNPAFVQDLIAATDKTSRDYLMGKANNANQQPNNMHNSPRDNNAQLVKDLVIACSIFLRASPIAKESPSKRRTNALNRALGETNRLQLLLQPQHTNTPSHTSTQSPYKSTTNPVNALRLARVKINNVMRAVNIDPVITTSISSATQDVIDVHARILGNKNNNNDNKNNKITNYFEPGKQA